MLGMDTFAELAEFFEDRLKEIVDEANL